MEAVTVSLGWGQSIRLKVLPVPEAFVFSFDVSYNNNAWHRLFLHSLGQCPLHFDIRLLTVVMNSETK